MTTHLSIVQNAPAKIVERSDSFAAPERGVPGSDSPKKRARVLFVVGEQAERYQDFFLSEMERLNSNGIVCYALISKAGDFSKRLSRKGFYYFLAPEPDQTIPTWRRNFSQTRKFCDFLNQYSFDAVVYAGPADIPTFRIAAWMSGIATRVAVTYDPAYCSSWAGESLESATSALDTKTVALSDWIAWKYQKLGRTDVRQHHLCGLQADGFDPGKFDLVAARADILSRLGISECTKLVCLFGDIQPYYPRTSFFPEHLFGVLIHDSHIFVESIKAVLEKHPAAHFVVVGAQKDAHGQGYAKSLNALALERGVAAHFHCLPEPEDVPHLLAAADIVVQPSHLDVAPNIVRALLMEKPVIATRRAGVPSVIEHNINGLLVPPDDVVALSEAIESLFDVDVAARLATSGRQSMLRRADLDRACMLFKQDEGYVSTRRDFRVLKLVRSWLGMYLVLCLKFMLKVRCLPAGKTAVGQKVCAKLASLARRCLRYSTARLKKVLH